MAASESDVRRLRRMVNEQGAGSGYNDVDLMDMIEVYPLPDAAGNEPGESDWAATYDLHAAASDIWTEKAAAPAQDYDFVADGGNYSRSQVHQQYMQMARYHAARRNTRTAELVQWPKERRSDAAMWIGNMPEID